MRMANGQNPTWKLRTEQNDFKTIWNKENRDMRNERAMRNGMRRAVLAAWMGVALVASGDAMAQATSKPPERITYQGFVAGSDGVALGNLAPKNYDVIFRIYDSEASNTPLWGEQQTVTVDKGYYSVLLGEGSAVTGVPNSGITLSSLFSGATASDRYVGFTVKGIGAGGTDVEVLPRIRFMSSPYAFLANQALTATLAETANVATTALTAAVATNVLNAANATSAFSLVRSNSPNAQLIGQSGTNLVVSAHLYLKSGQFIQLGGDVTNRQAEAGQIAYQRNTPDSLEIVGAGSDSTSRKITLFNEGGMTLAGPLKLYAGGQGQINFGAETSKEVNSGRIVYQGFTPDGLDIVGAGTGVDRRKTVIHGGILVWAANWHEAYPVYVMGAKSGTGVGLKVDNAVQASAFYATSDSRAKELVGTSSQQRDLNSLRKIRVAEYRWKSQPNQDRRIVKGVIAQEVQPLLPEAVTTSANIIPCDPIKASRIEWSGAGKPMQVITDEAHGLHVGDNIRLDLDGRQTQVSVSTVPDAKSYTVPTAGVPDAPKSVALVGREVQDFLNVDYQQVYMTAVSALQEVDRRVQDLEKREARIGDLERELAELRKLVVALSPDGSKAKQSASVNATGATASVAISR